MPITLESIVLFVKDIAALQQFYTSNFSFSIVEEIANEWVLLQVRYWFAQNRCRL
jgi:catechol-2,3-dioxygenase